MTPPTVPLNVIRSNDSSLISTPQSLIDGMLVSGRADERATPTRAPQTTIGSSSSPRHATNVGDSIGGLEHPPRRPLSAYNFFFQRERCRILEVTPTRLEGKPAKSHGKIGFAALAQRISIRWKKIGPKERAEFQCLAKDDKKRYQKEKDLWKKYHACQLTQGEAGNSKEIMGSSCANNNLNIIVGKATSSGFVNTKHEVVSWDEMDVVRRYAESDRIAELANALGWECLELLIDLFKE